MYDDLNDKILSVFKNYHSAIDPEIQQRAVEYSIMAQYDDQDLITQVWEAMPDFPERDSPLMKIIKQNQTETGDVAAGGASKVFKNAFSDDDDEDDDDDDDQDTDSEEETDEDEDQDEDQDEQQQTTQAVAQTQPQEQDFMSDLFGGGAVAASTGGGNNASSSSSMIELSQDKQNY
eukprot:CAMPEP_0201567208 /NCGR_PEP_ID=MMETSP0190_2-20130828/7603_1 /ASSEMBLY_ACC=CAM_ASM_000263 /TAXON_ID=37353 /ORGANISM="Rosalina sp." /LENGTH=175 /DNA_ID=CAMNT_0047986929 /DNA_START=1638 /DNA_END=2166 /DNA_ORIENTATION=-